MLDMITISVPEEDLLDDQKVKELEDLLLSIHDQSLATEDVDE
jgi:hypothetical protein